MEMELLRKLRKLHKKKLYELQNSPRNVTAVKSWRLRLAEHGARKEKYFQNFEEDLGIDPRRMWKDNIKTNLKEISYGDMKILAQYHVGPVAVGYGS
jgi:hypothetical protein